MRSRNQPLSALARVMQKFPQVLINIPVREKRDLDQVESVAAGRASASSARSPAAGRVYIRYSGTEALARVMVEGQDSAQVESYASDIADAVRAPSRGTTLGREEAASTAEDAVAVRA